MSKTKYGKLVSLFLALGTFACVAETPGITLAQAETCAGADVKLVKTKGGRLDWHPNGTRIAFDRRNALNGCYDVWTMNVDGSDETCLTCTSLDIPTNNHGQPAYHPSGRYLVFQVEKQFHLGNPCGIAANPGAGVYNDLYVMDLTTRKSRAIVTVQNGINYGVLHPHFSPDGTKLSWSQAYSSTSWQPGFEAGKWALMLGDVSIDGYGTMRISNVRQVLPKVGGVEGFIENHGFTPDNQSLLFTSNQGYGVQLDRRADVYRSDLTGGNLVQLTSFGYNEHGTISRAGKLAYMSSNWGSTGLSDGTEFYVANADGSNACRASHFNTPGYLEYQNAETTAADLSWSPDGSRFAGYSHSAWGSSELIWIIQPR
jgi:Tol biopolymer transport system component